MEEHEKVGVERGQILFSATGDRKSWRAMITHVHKRMKRIIYRMGYIFKKTRHTLNIAGLDWLKLISKTTYSIPVMCSEKVSLISLLKEKMNNFTMSISVIHCILKQVALCRKRL